MEPKALRHKIFKPVNAPADFAVLEIAGWGRDYLIYVPHFAAPLGEQYNLYLTDLRRKGECTGKEIISDLIAIDAKVRNLFQTDNLVYFGHSAAASLMIAAAQQHRQRVLGYFCMNMFPNFPEIYGSDSTPAPNNINKLFSMIVQHRNSGFLPRTIRNKICPEALDDLAYSLDNLDPAHLYFVNTERDGIVQHFFPSTRERLFDFYKTHGQLVRIKGKRDHLYNLHGENEFNKSAPAALIDAAQHFLAFETACLTAQRFNARS